MGASAGDRLPGLAQTIGGGDALAMAAGAVLAEQARAFGRSIGVDDVLSQRLDLFIRQLRSPRRHFEMQASLADALARGRLVSGERDRPSVTRGAVGAEETLAVGCGEEVEQRGPLGGLEK